MCIGICEDNGFFTLLNMSCNNRINVGVVDPTRSFTRKTCTFSMIGMCFYRCVYVNAIYYKGDKCMKKCR